MNIRCPNCGRKQLTDSHGRICPNCKAGIRQTVPAVSGPPPLPLGSHLNSPPPLTSSTFRSPWVFPAIIGAAGLLLLAIGIALGIGRATKESTSTDPSHPDFGNKSESIAKSGQKTSIAIPTTSTNSGQISRAELTKRIDPSVVLIHTESDESESIGSGFVVDTRGLVATNRHVVNGGGKLTVVFCDSSTARSAEVIYSHPTLDLAMIRITTATSLPPQIRLARALPSKGEDVAVFGAPEGLFFTTSFGNVSAIREEGRETWIQFTAPISPGNSGGPVVNMQGEVVGMTTWTYAKEHSQNLNFALSSVDIDRVLKRLRASDLIP